MDIERSKMTIDNWRIVVLPTGHAVVEGEVYNSPNFKDGTDIHTSGIKTVTQGDNCLIVETRNSTYKLPFRPYDNAKEVTQQ